MRLMPPLPSMICTAMVRNRNISISGLVSVWYRNTQFSLSVDHDIFDKHYLFNVQVVRFGVSHSSFPFCF